jgi:hypothetical protein
LQDYLMRHQEIASRCSKRSTIHFLTSENKDVFDAQVKQFISLEVRSEHIHF